MRVFTTLLLLAILVIPAVAAEDRISVERDKKTRDILIRIEAPGGRVTWEHVATGLARARGYGDDVLSSLVPDGSVQIDGLTGGLLLMGLNHLLQPAVTFRVEQPKVEGEPPIFAIKLGRRALLATKRRFVDMLQSAVTNAGSSLFGTKGDFGLNLEPGWDAKPKEKRLVVLVHGLNSAPEMIDSIVPDLERMGLPVGVFRFPNDQSLRASARLLSKELRAVRKQQPDRPITLLTHSMGGLVAREVVENPKLDPGNVKQLIMVAPPTRGSLLAEYSFAMEIWEFLSDRPEREFLERLYSRLEDGFGQAAEDMRPGSPFLERLNARKRNPKVSYTIFLGTKGTLTKKELEAFRAGLAEAGEENRFVRFFGSGLVESLADMEEVVKGKGDGAVAIKRGRLDGVKDTVILPFGHVAGWDRPEEAGSAALRKAVLERLSR